VRTFLGWIVLVAVLGGAAFLIAPVVAQPLIAQAVRTASPFGSEPLQVDVQADTPDLLTGHVARIHVTGSQLSSDQLDAGSLDVTVTDLSIFDRSFRAIDGSLGDVVLRRADGTAIHAARVSLTGPADATQAQAHLDRSEALDLIRGAFNAAGLPAEGLALADGGVRATVLGEPANVALGAEEGAAVMAGSVIGGRSIKLFGPEAGDPWRITAVTTSREGVDVSVSVDLAAALR
jgi:hypothetical protein